MQNIKGDTTPRVDEAFPNATSVAIRIFLRPRQSIPYMRLLIPTLLTILFTAGGTARSQTNSTNALEFRTWTFQKGTTLFAKAVDFKGTKALVLSLPKGGTTRIDFTQLVDQDCNILSEAWARIKGIAITGEGRIEVTKTLMENFHERVSQKEAWMECKFVKIDSDSLRDISSYAPEFNLGLVVEDKSDDYFFGCFVKRDSPIVPVIEKLKRNDHIMIKGKVVFMGTTHPWFDIQEIESKPALLGTPKEK